jgi:hypothetical protein
MKVIKLANGEALELNINFLTLKLVMESKIIDEKETEEEKNDPIIQFQKTAKLIYFIMYSNGKKITEDDALQLVPIGTDEETEEVFLTLIEEFQKRAENFKKKMEARQRLNQITK